MAEVICNNFRLIESQRICCLDKNSITIRYSFDENDTLEITFKFHFDNNTPRFTHTSTENGKIVFDLYNFVDPIGTGLKQPEPIGKYKGKEILIVFFVALLREANPILDYSLYMEV